MPAAVEYIKIPLHRVAVLIGPKGQAKKELENRTRCKVKIGSKTGNVNIEGEDASNTLKAANIVQAIGRGFSPTHAFHLLQEDQYLEVLDLREMIGKNPHSLNAKRGRVIGRNGSIREKIQEKTDCLVSVQGKTIALLGKAEDLERAKKAIEMLLGGASHISMLKYLDRMPREEPAFNLE